MQCTREIEEKQRYTRNNQYRKRQSDFTKHYFNFKLDVQGKDNEKMYLHTTAILKSVKMVILSVNML